MCTDHPPPHLRLASSPSVPLFCIHILLYIKIMTQRLCFFIVTAVLCTVGLASQTRIRYIDRRRRNQRPFGCPRVGRDGVFNDDSRGLGESGWTCDFLIRWKRVGRNLSQQQSRTAAHRGIPTDHNGQWRRIISPRKGYGGMELSRETIWIRNVLNNERKCW